MCWLHCIVLVANCLSHILGLRCPRGAGRGASPDRGRDALAHPPRLPRSPTLPGTEIYLPCSKGIIFSLPSKMYS
jgi:hypothetical protein